MKKRTSKSGKSNDPSQTGPKSDSTVRAAIITAVAGIATTLIIYLIAPVTLRLLDSPSTELSAQTSTPTFQTASTQMITSQNTAFPTEENAETSSAVIPFSNSINSKNLNSVFIWQPGGSPENSYDLELNPGELTLIAGAYTDQWQLTTSSPLVTYPITGNFEVQVRVHCNPTKNYQIAGLGIRSTENQNSWARIARAYFDGQIVGISDHRNGQESFGEGVPFSRETVYLKILRYESLLTFSYSMNGVDWVILEKDLVVDLPQEVEIYLFAFSAQNNSGFVARFKDFSITKK